MNTANTINAASDKPAERGKETAPAFVWSAPEFAYKEKSADWFLAVGVISFSLIVSAFFLGNVLLAILVGVGAFALVVSSLRRPRTMAFTVTETSIRLGDESFLFKDLSSFWILKDGAGARLLLHGTRPWSPRTVVPIADTVDREALRTHLARHLAEEEQREPFAYLLFERLGF